MNVTYHTVVAYLPPTPLGLLAGRWTIHHRCTTCRQDVSNDELVAHADSHHNTDTGTGTGTDPIVTPPMHNDHRQDRHPTPNDTSPALPTTTDTQQRRR